MLIYSSSRESVWNRRSAPATGHGLDWHKLVVPADALAPARDRFEAAGFDTSRLDSPGVESTDEGTGDDADGFAVRDSDGVELRVRPRDP